jgi:hypothetical protein
MKHYLNLYLPEYARLLLAYNDDMSAILRDKILRHKYSKFTRTEETPKWILTNINQVQVHGILNSL